MAVMNHLSIDEQIQRNVLDELHWDNALRPTEVGVEVTDGVVTLSGTVDTYHKRREAAEAALRVYGVRGLVNDIGVDPGHRFHSDTKLARMVADTLEWDSVVPENRVKVRVANGWVTLEGTVNSAHQKRAVEATVSKLAGIRGVTNLIEIEPQGIPAISAPKLAEGIEKAFMRSAEIDARRIRVRVQDHTVTLSGNVSSWSEYCRAEEAAWSMPGVQSVENALEVQP